MKYGWIGFKGPCIFFHLCRLEICSSELNVIHVVDQGKFLPLSWWMSRKKSRPFRIWKCRKHKNELTKHSFGRFVGVKRNISCGKMKHSSPRSMLVEIKYKNHSVWLNGYQVSFVKTFLKCQDKKKLFVKSSLTVNPFKFFLFLQWLLQDLPRLTFDSKTIPIFIWLQQMFQMNIHQMMKENDISLSLQNMQIIPTIMLFWHANFSVLIDSIRDIMQT